MSHISDPPIFSSTCMSLQDVCVSSRGFLFGVCLGVFCLEGFVRGGFCTSLVLSEYIHYNRKLNITFNFRFHMYEFFLKSVMSHALRPPSPCHKLSHLLGPLPLERDVLYGRPNGYAIQIVIMRSRFSNYLIGLNMKRNLKCVYKI